MSGEQTPGVDLGRLRVPWWMTIVVFVLGLGVGVLAVGLLNASTPGFVAEKQAQQSAAPQPSSAATVQVAAEARVNAACLRVINQAQDVASALDGIDEAVTQLDLRRLDDIVRRLDPLQLRLQHDVAACEIDTATGSSPEPSGTPAPGASPSTEPTTEPSASPTR